MNNANLRIPRYVITAAFISRAIVLIALVGCIISVYSSDIVIKLAAKYVPTRAAAVLVVVSFFIFYNRLYCVPVSIVSELVLFYVAKIIAKEKINGLFFILTTAASAYFFFSLFVQKVPPLFFLIYVAVSTLSELIILGRPHLFAGRFLPFGTFCRNIFICMPFLVELFFPFEALYYLSSQRFRSYGLFDRVVQKAGPVYTATAISIITCYLLTIAAINSFIIPFNIKGDAKRVSSGDFYSLQLDKKRDYLIATNQKKEQLEIYDVRQKATKLFDVAIPTEEIQDVRINIEKNELYHFDRGRNALLVYNLDSFSPKKESIGNLDGHGSARVSFDNASNTIAITREDDFMWIVDMTTLQPVKKLSIADWNEFIVFNKQLNAFVLSYFSKYPFIQIVSPDGQSCIRIHAKLYQGGIDFATQHNELFIALPLVGKIAVYDIPSLKLKRLVPTVFGVRSVAYDSVRDLLLTASLCDGHVDIIDRSSGKICKRIFVGYWLREICLNENKGEMYISSPLGGLYSLKY